MPLAVVIVGAKDATEQFEEEMGPVKKQIAVKLFTATTAVEGVQALSKAMQACGRVDVALLHHNFTAERKAEYAEALRKQLREKYPDVVVIGFGNEAKGGQQKGKSYHYWLDWSKGELSVPDMVRMLRDVQSGAMPAAYDPKYMKGGSFSAIKSFTRSGSVERRSLDLPREGSNSPSSRSSTPQRTASVNGAGLERVERTPSVTRTGSMERLMERGQSAQCGGSFDAERSITPPRGMEYMGQQRSASSLEIDRNITPPRGMERTMSLGMGMPGGMGMGGMMGMAPGMMGMAPGMMGMAGNPAMMGMPGNAAMMGMAGNPAMMGMPGNPAMMAMAGTPSMAAMGGNANQSMMGMAGNPVGNPAMLGMMNPGMTMMNNSFAMMGLNQSMAGNPAMLGMGAGATPAAAAPQTVPQPTVQGGNEELIQMLAAEVARLRKALEEKQQGGMPASFQAGQPGMFT